MKRKDCYIYRLLSFYIIYPCNVDRYYNKQLSIARIRPYPVFVVYLTEFKILCHKPKLIHLHPYLMMPVQTLQADGTLPSDWQNNSQITRTKDLSHGDFASNIALTAAKAAKANPRQLAEKIVSALPENQDIRQVEIAGPGFINVFLNSEAKFSVLDDIFTLQERFGLSNQFDGQKSTS